MRAGLEAIAYQTRDLLQVMIQDSQVELTHLKVDGAAVSNNLLMQFQADIADVQVHRSTFTETTALGAAFLAGLGVGFWTSLEQLKASQIEHKRFIPQMSEGIRNRLCQGWLQAVQRTLSHND